ncbi:MULTISPECIES: transporter substrate-binding domain-containing protein [Burkholderiales]|uniref:Transporter substrate-binding domain-containing protein n=1 Tax=Piscinibacter gummiphilus TaxID=946333 RepID=A0ABZ0CYW1_9BURK|nr:transporter substrate-binding domain-containing protein [Piscinibacter gummiphilus]WOB09696.1 transporter substrate-binding domain-containing protein [Piscinibacter gummiphilus]
MTIDLARILAGRLGLTLQLLEFDTPGAAGAALSSGAADIGFLAVDPVRAQKLRFTSPYVRIEGAYLVRESSPLVTNEDVDRPGIRVVVGTASAYALFLERHLSQAKLVEVPRPSRWQTPSPPTRA